MSQLAGPAVKNKGMAFFPRKVGRQYVALSRWDRETLEDDERDGYVPNVLYSCGALRHGDRLLLPYGASDASVRFAVVDVPLLLERLAADGPPATMREKSRA
jgi:predicted GH43/DUF377 family glycosyl hydrolase